MNYFIYGTVNYFGNFAPLYAKAGYSVAAVVFMDARNVVRDFFKFIEWARILTNGVSRFCLMIIYEFWWKIER